MKLFSIIVGFGSLVVMLFSTPVGAQSMGRSLDAIDAEISAAQEERAVLQEFAEDTSVIYVSTWWPRIALPVRRDRLDTYLYQFIPNPGETVPGMVKDLLRGDREYRRELLHRVKDLSAQIARLGQEATAIMGTNQLSESAYIDQLRIENYDQPPSASGVLSVSVLNIVSRGRQSGRDLYTVNLEIMNHGGRKLTFKSGVFRYTVYDPPGRKTTEQKISYRVADLDPGLKTGIGNSCEGPPPDYVGTWSAEGTAVDPVTQEVHNWKINGTCP